MLYSFSCITELSLSSLAKVHNSLQQADDTKKQKKKNFSWYQDRDSIGVVEFDIQRQGGDWNRQ